VAAAVLVFGSVVVLHVAAAADVLVVFAVALQSPVVAAAAAVVLSVAAAAAAELAVAVSALERFAIGMLVGHDVAVVVAGPQALPTAFVREHCFVVDWMPMPLVKRQVFSCPA